MKSVLCSTSLAFLLVGCTTLQIPPEKAAWAESVRQQIALANETNYVYVAVANKEDAKLVERLASRQGKETQKIKRNGQLTECVFTFGPERYLNTSLLPPGQLKR